MNMRDQAAKLSSYFLLKNVSRLPFSASSSKKKDVAWSTGRAVPYI